MAGLKISQLLKWKTNVILLDPSGNPILGEDKKPVEVWLRIIGDDDLEAVHRISRIASSTIRKQLRDKGSAEYKDRVEPIMEAAREDCIEVLRQYRTSNLSAEAAVTVVREDLPTIEEVAVEPDAPTLEEIEKLDQAILDQEVRYDAQVKEYIDDRTAVIMAELENLSTEELRDLTREEISGVVALATFYTSLLNEKVYRAAYVDKEFKERAFDSVEDFIATDGTIKQQLIEAYTDLETSPNEVKK